MGEGGHRRDWESGSEFFSAEEVQKDFVGSCIDSYTLLTENHPYTVSVIPFYGHIWLLFLDGTKLLFRDNIDAFEIQLIILWEYLKFAFTICNDYIDEIWWMQRVGTIQIEKILVCKVKYRSL